MIKLNILKLSSLAMFIGIISGCAGMDGALSVTGTIDGDAVPASSEAAVLWFNDYDGTDTQKYGGGTATNDVFSIDLQGPPPPRSNAAPGLAVGMVALYEAGYLIPDGPVSSEVADPIVGISARYAIIWKDDDSSGNAEFPWAAGFAAGYSCAACTQGAPDGYAPVPCDEVVVDVRDDGSLYEWCNWFPEPQ